MYTIKNEFLMEEPLFASRPLGLAGGKEHRETARNGRSVAPDEPAQPECMG
ncbi:MAG TPA: hypothetical protein PLR57_01670 [Clostridia bacterium]|nr:hypothetical protein [Clostridia bacterium]